MTVRTLAELGEIAESAASQFQRRPGAQRRDRSTAPASALAAFTARAQELLAGLGLSTPSLDRAIAAGLRHGGVSGKMSGAGGGGAFFVLFESAIAAVAALPVMRETFRDDPAEERPALYPLQWDGRSVRLLPPTGSE